MIKSKGRTGTNPCRRKETKVLDPPLRKESLRLGPLWFQMVLPLPVPLLCRTRLAKPVKRDRERNFLPRPKNVTLRWGTPLRVREDQVILGTLQSSDLIILNNGFAWKSRESTNEDQNVLFGKLARILLFEFKGKGREKPFALVDSHFKDFCTNSPAFSSRLFFCWGEKVWNCSKVRNGMLSGSSSKHRVSMESVIDEDPLSSKLPKTGRSGMGCPKADFRISMSTEKRAEDFILEQGKGSDPKLKINHNF